MLSLHSVTLSLFPSFARLTLCLTEEEEEEEEGIEEEGRKKEKKKERERMFSVSLKCRLGVIRRRTKGTVFVCVCVVKSRLLPNMLPLCVPAVRCSLCVSGFDACLIISLICVIFNGFICKYVQLICGDVGLDSHFFSVCLTVVCV